MLCPPVLEVESKSFFGPQQQVDVPFMEHEINNVRIKYQTPPNQEEKKHMSSWMGL